MRRAGTCVLYRRMASVLLAVLSLFIAASHAGADAVVNGLRHDPFARRAVPPPTSASAPFVRAGESAAPVEAPPPPWQPQLRGIMLAGRASVANVGGTVVGLGESIDGWRLIRLEDGFATFVKGRQQTVLSMHTPGQSRP